MRLSLRQLQESLAKRPEFTIGWLIFLSCLFVYLANDRSDLGSNDNIPHTLLAFNWLQNQTLHLDAFRNGYLYRGEVAPYFFAEGTNGHLTSGYPIGTPLIAFPLYICFFLYLKCVDLIQVITAGIPPSLDVTSEDFASYQRLFSKLAGTISTALSVVIFYFGVRLKFDRSIALITAFIFAFATSSWALNAQDLRQHTISNLVLVSIMLCLFKADRTSGRKQQVLLFVAGVFSGLMPAVRLTSAIFSLAAAVYATYAFRKQSIFFWLGLPSAIIQFAWNFYYFGLENVIAGGYVEQFESGASSYVFTAKHFINVFLGLLVSPSEGLFVFSPILLFAIPGAYSVFQQRSGNDQKLLLCLLSASVILFLQYCFYGSWLGGSGSYGYRFLSDVTPILCFCVAYVLTELFRNVSRYKKPIAQGILVFFGISLFFSTSVQAIGAFTNTDWGQSPLPLLTEGNRRIWYMQDSQIERHFRNLLVQITQPIDDRKQHVQGLNGSLEKLEIITVQGETLDITDPLVLRTGGRRVRRVLRAIVRNTGESPWYGYQSGMMGVGETKLRIQFIDSEGKERAAGFSKWLNIAGVKSGIVPPGTQTEATGRVDFPRRAGNYQMEFYLASSGLNDELNGENPPIYTLNVTILPKNS
ncbi:MAG: hypothetical protein Kow00121_13160 [Elainellaceae cyanobacterium]